MNNLNDFYLEEIKPILHQEIQKSIKDLSLKVIQKKLFLELNTEFQEKLEKERTIVIDEEINNQKKVFKRMLVSNNISIKNTIKQKWRNLEKEYLDEEITTKYINLYLKYKQKKQEFSDLKNSYDKKIENLFEKIVILENNLKEEEKKKIFFENNIQELESTLLKKMSNFDEAIDVQKNKFREIIERHNNLIGKNGRNFDTLFRNNEIHNEKIILLDLKTKEISLQLKNSGNLDAANLEKINDFNENINKIAFKLNNLEKTILEENKNKNKNENENKNNDIVKNNNKEDIVYKKISEHKIFIQNNLNNKEKIKDIEENISNNNNDKKIVTSYNDNNNKKENNGVFDEKLAKQVENLKPNEIIKLDEPKYVLVTKKNPQYKFNNTTDSTFIIQKRKIFYKRRLENRRRIC